MRAAVALVPALLAAAVAVLTADGVEAPWLLLGAEFRADATGRVFLLLAAVVWTAAGLAAGPLLRRDDVRTGRLLAFAAVALAGNLGAAVAQDAVSFYACFSAMSLAAYGLVAARGDAPALRAGRVYVTMAVAAEAALLAGLLLAVRTAGGLDFTALRAGVAAAPERDAILALLLAGFGVKAGVLGLHLWMPLAYAAAPLPAAAVLAGALTELGLLGWLRVLPIGAAGLEGWGVVLVVTGLGGVAYGVVAGATQVAAPPVLAYSSLGQIGLMVAGVGVALARPELAPAAVAAVLLLALHHGVVKAALFLALGVERAARTGAARAAARTALVLLALALAGAPATSGAAAKEALKTPAAAWWPGMEWALALSAAATAVLMGRVLMLVWRRDGRDEPLEGTGAGAGLGLGVAAAAALPLLAGRWSPFAAAETAAPSVGGTWAGLWPLGLGLAAAVGLARLATARPGARVRVPAGDVVVAAERLGASVHRLAEGLGARTAALTGAVRSRLAGLDAAPLWRAVAAAEARGTGYAAGALALAALVVVVAVAAR